MFKLFGERSIEAIFIDIRGKMVHIVDSMPEYEILGSEIEELASRISTRCQIPSIEVDLTNREAKVELIALPAQSFPRSYDVEYGKSYPCARVKYSFPIFKGEKGLLSVWANKAGFKMGVDATLEEDNLVVYFQTLYRNVELSEEVRIEAKKFISDVVVAMRNILSALDNEVKNFNYSLSSFCFDLIKEKKEAIIARKSQEDDLAKF